MQLADLEALLRRRRDDLPAAQAAGSYSATLLADPRLAGRKLVEEALELCLELVRDPVDGERVTAEAADVLYHLLVGLVGAGIELEAVLDELRARRAAAASGRGEAR